MGRKGRRAGGRHDVASRSSAARSVARTPCVYYQSGSCAYGSSCRYSHAKQAAVCRYWQQYNCSRGDSCLYRHEGPGGSGDGGGGGGGGGGSASSAASRRAPSLRRPVDAAPRPAARAAPPVASDFPQFRSEEERERDVMSRAIDLMPYMDGDSLGEMLVMASAFAEFEADMAEEEALLAGALPPGDGYGYGYTPGSDYHVHDHGDDDVVFYGAAGGMGSAPHSSARGRGGHSRRGGGSGSSGGGGGGGAAAAGAASPRKACVFFQRGACRFGDSCRNAHVLEAAPRWTSDMALDDDAAAEAAWVAKEDAASRKASCNICMDCPLTSASSDKRFGLLSECDHAFCLTCIREWRARSGDYSKDAVLGCPVCRVISYVVVPAKRLVTEAGRKARLLEAYRTSKRRVACKHWDLGRGVCPFSSSCMYAHLNPDGTPAMLPRMRAYVDAEAAMSVIAPVVLSEFLS